VYLDFADSIQRLGKDVIWSRYSNLFHMYELSTGDDPFRTPMKIAPSVHFCMGGLWSDYDMMTSIPGLFVGGEVGWGYHGANRLGASSLLAGTVDGWFTLPYSVPNYLAPLLGAEVLPLDDPAVTDTIADVEARIARLLSNNGTESPDRFHAKLGQLLYRHAGVERTPEGLLEGIKQIRQLRQEFWENVRVVGEGQELNQELERAGRVADYLELAELICLDGLDRNESCGAHFRSDHITADGEALRDDENFCYVSAWESPAITPDQGGQFVLHKEPLTFIDVPLQTRNYK
jgi:succinate dehydrogenase / fumarate reductase flavoprotein subunit